MFQPKKALAQPARRTEPGEPAKESDEMAKAKVAALRKKKPPMPSPETESC